MQDQLRSSPFKTCIFFGTMIVIGLLFGIAIAEVFVRVIEPDSLNTNKLHVTHPLLGWVPSPGKTTVTTAEYIATYDVNSLGMNDRQIPENIQQTRLRIMALGDSTTFGQGVSQQDTWPKVLEQRLFGDDTTAGAVYNLGVIGYSLGQYLVRMRELQAVLKPQILLLGFCMHNDLYDLIPPRLGGFAIGEHFGRVYFDLDAEGNLIELHDLVGKDPTKEASSPKNATSLRIRWFLARNFALYRRYRTSHFAMWIATHVRPGGESLLWPGIDTALKKKLDPADEYRWRLAEKIIQKIATEARGREMKVVLVNIPYHPQVYDDVWESSFGTLPEKYDRWIAGERLEQISKRAGIYYLDTTMQFTEEARRRKAWVHYRHDRHPTAEGHKIIAETVLIGLKNNGLLNW